MKKSKDIKKIFIEKEDKKMNSKDVMESMFKNMLVRDKQGLVKINKGVLETCKNIQKKTGGRNKWYTVTSGDKEVFRLLEVEDCQFKVVPGGECGDFLMHYKWRQYGKRTVAYIGGKDVCIERVIVCQKKHGIYDASLCNKEVHHMWFRCVALYPMLKEVTRKEHTEGHKIVGFYDRAQTLIIESVADFQYMVSQILAMEGLVKNRQFSWEY